MQRTIEQFVEGRPFERGPWLVVGFGAGIAAWAILPGPWQWCAFLAACTAAAALAPLFAPEGKGDHTRHAIWGMALMLAAGCGVIWAKSVLVGRPAIAHREVVMVNGRIVDRQDEGAEGRLRLVLLARIEGESQPTTIRVTLPETSDQPQLVVGAMIAARARLVPPSPPMLPGGYDFAKTAWFQGIGATGSILGDVTVLSPAGPVPSLRRVQDALARHVLAQLGGSPGAIAAALASGDRGAIAREDEDAMRDAGLTHLLSISGLHVSAVIAGVYFLTIRLLGLFPWIALRVRLPVVAAAAGATTGIAYCLVTGSEVPTVRSVVGALLVLGALVLGRDPLSLRLLAVAAFFVMLFWPEAVLGPSFQMSFASVMAIIAVHNAAPVKRFLAKRDEGRLMRLLRETAMLLASGVVIELTLMPIALFHFHRAGIYGAFANLVAIPLTTFTTMPAIALALVLDLAGLGAPAWWVTGKSLEALLWLAHITATMPGAVTMMPTMPGWIFGIMLAGLLWLGLWSGRVRLWGLLPVALGCAVYAGERAPDVLISGDGRHVGLTGLGPDLVVLRPGRGGYAREALLESAGMSGDVRLLEDWPGARCNVAFCMVRLARGGRSFALLFARGTGLVDIDQLEAACAASDIVVADRRLPQACRPRLLKADLGLLERTGGMTIDLVSGRIHTVAENRGEHPWVQQAGIFGAPHGGPAVDRDGAGNRSGGRDGENGAGGVDPDWIPVTPSPAVPVQ
ncbi:ComEC/Rec2-related protein [Novosphingobium nitrogenifigens DSM 19370]|uniref:ComEC/Rec2-related protein n=1 Tax=Novosphingobium nitrogenifigens DSM 19370 TaxID=983920 RepID=F1Z9K1_9SPHN|nr:ComEC/Rec2 family competence protein [Novosphingobium nitrogenifigens]EGD58741.1 ComEC/Rec2-related protein [Novosphingobium nitrogenifigens DSM 19370]